MKTKLPMIFLALVASLTHAANPQLGFPELQQNQAQPHVTINGADRSITNAVAGQLQINFTTNANYTLSSTQWAYATIVMTDTGPVLSTGRDVIYPNVDSLTGGSSRMRFYFRNSTAQTLTVKRSGQTGVAVSAGTGALLQHNGTDIEEVTGGVSGTVDLTSDVTGILPSNHGGTNNGFSQFTGPASSLKTFTLPNASATILTTDAAVTLAQGGTGVTSASDDTTLVSNGTAWQTKAIPDCDDTGGNHLNYDTGTNAYSCGTSGGGGGGSPGGSDTQVQFNSSGSFAGDADWTWNSTTNVMSLGTLATPARIRGFSNTGTTGTGGNLTMSAGQGGSTSGSGGELILRGGDSTGQGGQVTVRLADGSVDGSFQVRNAADSVTVFGVFPSGNINVNGDFGSTNNVLVSAGFGAAAWGQLNLASSNAVTGVLPWANYAKPPFRTVTAAGTITVVTTDKYICVNKTTGAATAVTGQASPATSFELHILDCKGDAATNNITFTPAAGTVDGAANLVINTNYGAASLVYTGAMWKIVSVR